MLFRLYYKILIFLARRDDFLVGQAIRLSPPAVAGVWLRLCCFVGHNSAGSACSSRSVLDDGFLEQCLVRVHFTHAARADTRADLAGSEFAPR
jgi:hypothetical protein